MTDGFVDYDANGQRCRIFLDLVGFLAAINESLDTLGHTANVFCHLCRYAKQSTGSAGSRCGGGGSHGMLTGTRRCFHVHAAVRDCNAQKETCRLLGMKPTTTEHDLPLHALRLAIIQAKNRVPKTLSGTRLLSGYLDPYQACFVAPDHLLTGHFRDCINLVYKLLPNACYRTLSEKYMILYLTHAKIKTHNRLFDIEKKCLYSMSMTELYSLSTVAEISFTKACQELESPAGSSAPQQRISVECRDTIALVGRLAV